LNYKLTAQAREQLTKVVELNSQNRQAKFMLLSIDQEAVRLANRRRDPDVMQTRADSMADDRPIALGSAFIQGAKREMGISGLPIIFDLPRPLALLRAQEFERRVHPLLQVLCAKCHNGEYDGPFQLVPIKSRVDRTPEALRANLDVTLQFIDQENPSKSELLSSTLRPHGKGPNKRPIFPGSNDQAYQVLATWVNNLRPSGKVGGDPPRGAVAGRTRTNDSETFAADHNRIGRESEEPTSAEYTGRSEQPTFAGTRSGEAKVPPPSRPGVGRGQDPNDMRPQEFPLPFAVSGTKPVLPSTKPAPKSSTSAQGDTAAKAAAPAAKKPAKPQLILDPELLQRVLQGQNANNRQ
jgi:hypothetical protein